jgi:hypothetical protein
MGIGNSKTSVCSNIQGSGSNNQIVMGDAAFQFKPNTSVREVMNTLGKATSKVIESGGDIISAPAVWLKTMQENWITYLVLIAVILGIIAFFYCSCCVCANWKQAYPASNGLVDLAKIINSRNNDLPHPKPFSINIPSVETSTSREPTV